MLTFSSCCGEDQSTEWDMAEILVRPALDSTELDHVVQVRVCPLSFGLESSSSAPPKITPTTEWSWMLGYDYQPQVIGRSPSHRGSACLRYSMLLFELYSLRVYSIIYQIY